MILLPFWWGTIGGLWPHPLVWSGLVVLALLSRSQLPHSGVKIVVWALLGVLVGQLRYGQHHRNLTAAWELAPRSLQEEPALVVGGLDRRESKAFLPVRLLKTGAKVRVTTSPYAAVWPGDTVRLNCPLEWPEPPQPGEFDYTAWLLRYGFVRTCRANFLTPDTAAPATSNAALAWLRRSEQVRDGLLRHIYRTIPDPEASFLAGLLVGARATMPPHTATALQRTGTTHVIAVSGANVMIIAGSLLWLTRFLTQRGPPSLLLTVGGIWAFVILTGTSAAAVRGGLVATASLLITAAGRRPSPLALVSGTAFLTLLINPLIWQDIGWQLSLAAFSGLLVYDPWLDQKMQRLRWQPPGPLRQPLTQTVAASLPTLPLTMWHFGSFTLTAFLANPLVLWLIPISTWTGLGAVGADALLPALAPLWRLLGWLPLHLALLIIETLARLPWQLTL